MTTHEINLLIERYLDGETTPAEEHELALAVQQEGRPAEWAIIAEMLGELTADEALYERPTPLNPPERGEVVTVALSEEVSAPAQTTPPARGAGGGGRWVPWAAAACVAVTFALSYDIINRPAKETAQVTPPKTTEAPTTTTEVLAITTEAPATTTEAPATTTEAPATTTEAPATTTEALAEAPIMVLQETSPVHNQPLSKAETASSPSPAPKAKRHPSKPIGHPQAPSPQEPQPLAQAQTAALTTTPPHQEETEASPDLALHLALLAEVEARALAAEQNHPSDERLRLGLIDELLANILQLSNRPELSL